MHLSFSLRRAVIAAAVALAALPAGASASPFAKGPDPTPEVLAEKNGPYATKLTALPNSKTPNFGTAWIYAPQGAPGETFGGVAMSPGFLADGQTLSWLARRLASHGFVTIVFTPHSIVERPPARARELLAALDYLTQKSAVRGLVDPERLAVVGHSMGGGGALDAALLRPSIKAVVSLMVWNKQVDFGALQSPTLVISSKPDWIAPIRQHAVPIYRSLPAALPKAYLETTIDHATPIIPVTDISRPTVSWLKRFLDDDERYTPALCPGIVGVRASLTTKYESSCGVGPLGAAVSAN